MERSAWPKNLSSSGKQAIKELLDGQNPTKKIRHLFDAHSQTGNNTAQPLIAEDLIVNFLGSFSNTLSLSSSAAESYEVLQVPTNACVRSEVSEGSESINAPPVPTDAPVSSEVSEGSESIHTSVPRWTLHTWDLNLIDEGNESSTDDQNQSILIAEQDDCNNNNNPIFFDFLSVNQEQKLASEDGLNPHGHSDDNKSSNHQSTTTNNFHVPETHDLEMVQQTTKDDPPLDMITCRGQHICKNLLVKSPQLILDSPSPREEGANGAICYFSDVHYDIDALFDGLEVFVELKDELCLIEELRAHNLFMSLGL